MNVFQSRMMKSQSTIISSCPVTAVSHCLRLHGRAEGAELENLLRHGKIDIISISLNDDPAL